MYPPRQTLYRWFRRWQRDGVWAQILALLQARADATTTSPATGSPAPPPGNPPPRAPHGADPVPIAAARTAQPGCSVTGGPRAARQACPEPGPPRPHGAGLARGGCTHPSTQPAPTVLSGYSGHLRRPGRSPWLPPGRAVSHSWPPGPGRPARRRTHVPRYRRLQLRPDIVVAAATSGALVLAWRRSRRYKRLHRAAPRHRLCRGLSALCPIMVQSSGGRRDELWDKPSSLPIGAGLGWAAALDDRLPVRRLHQTCPP